MMLPSEVEAIRKRHPTARGPIIGSLYGGNLTILLKVLKILFPLTQQSHFQSLSKRNSMESS